MQKILILILLILTVTGCANQYVLEQDATKPAGDALPRKEIDPKMDPYNET